MRVGPSKQCTECAIAKSDGTSCASVEEILNRWRKHTKKCWTTLRHTPDQTSTRNQVLQHRTLTFVKRSQHSTRFRKPFGSARMVGLRDLMVSLRYYWRTRKYGTPRLVPQGVDNRHRPHRVKVRRHCVTAQGKGCAKSVLLLLAYIPPVGSEESILLEPLLDWSHC